MVKISQQSFCYKSKIGRRYVKPTFPTVILWNKSQVTASKQ